MQSAGEQPAKPDLCGPLRFSDRFRRNNEKDLQRVQRSENNCVQSFDFQKKTVMLTQSENNDF